MNRALTDKWLDTAGGNKAASGRSSTIATTTNTGHIRSSPNNQQPETGSTTAASSSYTTSYRSGGYFRSIRQSKPKPKPESKSTASAPNADADASTAAASIQSPSSACGHGPTQSSPTRIWRPSSCWGTKSASNPRIFWKSACASSAADARFRLSQSVPESERQRSQASIRQRYR